MEEDDDEDEDVDGKGEGEGGGWGDIASGGGIMYVLPCFSIFSLAQGRGLMKREDGSGVSYIVILYPSPPFIPF